MHRLASLREMAPACGNRRLGGQRFHGLPEQRQGQPSRAGDRDIAGKAADRVAAEERVDAEMDDPAIGRWLLSARGPRHVAIDDEDRIRLAEVNTTPDVAEIVGSGVYRWRSLASRSSAGVIVYPGAATPEKGEKLLAAISRDLADKICNKELWTLPWR